MPMESWQLWHTPPIINWFIVRLFMPSTVPRWRCMQYAVPSGAGTPSTGLVIFTVGYDLCAGLELR